MTTSTAMPASPAPVISRFNPWREVAFLGTVIMETTWLVMIYQSLGEQTASDPSSLVFYLFGLIFVAALYFGKALTSLRLAKNIEWGAIAAFFLLAYFAGISLLLQNAALDSFDAFTTQFRGVGELTRIIPGRFWLVLALVWIVWRGIELARQGIGTFAVQRHLKLGFTMWLLYSILAFAATRDLPGLEYFILFVFATLMAMSSARVSVLGKFRGGQRSPFSRSWLGSMAFVNLSTVGVGLSLAMLTTGRFASFFQSLIVMIFGAIVSLAISPVLLILALFGNTTINPIEAPPAAPELPPWEQAGEYAGFVEIVPRSELLPPEAQTAVGIIVFGISFIVLLMLVFGIRWMYMRQKGGRSVEYVIDRGDFLEFFRRQARNRRNEVMNNLAGLNPLGRGQRILAAAKIRRIYAKLMDLAVEIDCPRSPAETPLEFLTSIQGGLPSRKDELALITHAYLKVRYGELPETREEVAAVDSAWELVETSGVEKAKIVQVRKREEAKERKRIERIS